MIKLKNLSKEFTQGIQSTRVLDNINLTIDKGEFVAITGASGSGKTTLMQIIGCLDSQSSGEYILDNQSVKDKNEKQLAQIRNQVIGFVFQNFHLLPRLTAMENVEIPLIYKGIPKRKRRQMSIELLERLGLRDRTDYRPSQLSGGQKQRVAIARALANKPKILIADEPTGALDTKTSTEVMDIFKELNDEGLTTIIVTHERSIASSTNREIVVSDGILLSDGKKEYSHESS
ncbi:macrolide ABC transporter ATP-binding protein [Terribacillus saccharophilus]|uniref:ABC transporter ATP-binding protein n=1 Tax=Terribacillus saccharophilus TaxID=361277 RepID=UPI000BA7DBFE|nr:ABC transporter ATP-binding protein [Terribacillus saccharophilus]PAF23105.1 macrolide ABC transporter ATP-binding protein [Terribacillus saccharophilus]PAF34052.1 macrolide ABC transporter ATP-binding protein [Terribacillus saccharophilus]PAF36793.1 macrolide ABC transporter ATP-binding protein [Terribacillus saccharophilus]